MSKRDKALREVDIHPYAYGVMPMPQVAALLGRVCGVGAQPDEDGKVHVDSDAMLDAYGEVDLIDSGRDDNQQVWCRIFSAAFMRASSVGRGKSGANVDDPAASGAGGPVSPQQTPQISRQEQSQQSDSKPSRGSKTRQSTAKSGV